MINENQCTIGWFVDDNKVSHIDDSVNSMIADKIEDKFGKIFLTRGNNHTFIGMGIDFIGEKIVALTTPHHGHKDLEDLVKNTKVNVVNPATSKLFTITDEAKEINEKRKDHYH